MPKQISIELLRPGLPLPGSVRDESGTCLLEAGTCLSESDIGGFKACGLEHFWVDDDWPDALHACAVSSEEAFATADPQDNPPELREESFLAQASGAGERTISVECFRKELYMSVRGGMSLPHNIYDENGVLLLAAGVQITPRFLQLLRERGVEQISLRPPPSEAETITDLPASADETDEPSGSPRITVVRLDDQLAGELARQPVLRPVKAWRRPRLSFDGFKSEAVVGRERHAAACRAVAEFCEQLDFCLDHGGRIPDTEVRQAVVKFTEMAAQDFDLLPFILSQQQAADRSLFDHSVNVAMLSLAVAHQLGLNHAQIVEIGLGALLQDAGLIRVPESIRNSAYLLSPDEREELERHPLYTLDLLEAVRGLPPTVKLIAYQSHERMDGSGYPRGRCGAQIHHFARIVGIADSYVTRTRRHDQGVPDSPYQATKDILIETSHNKFDPAIVRAFLDTVSLFPIGSRLQLTNGLRARVLRANPGLHTRPIVEALDPSGRATGQVLDLSKETGLRVISAFGGE